MMKTKKFLLKRKCRCVLKFKSFKPLVLFQQEKIFRTVLQTNTGRLVANTKMRELRKLKELCKMAL